MKIGVDSFQARFVQQAPRRLADPVLQAMADRVDLNSSPAVAAAFGQMALAVSVSTAGIPALAALAQEIARGLVTPQQELELAEAMQDGFESRFVPNQPSLQEAWQEVQRVTGSQFPAPQQVNSPIVYAQADSRNLYIGQQALEGDLGNPDVLTFSLAHEEGHRQNRDTAGAKGLETLLEACQSEAELFAPAFRAVRAGRHQNEHLADQFAARVAAKAGCAPLPILQFLLSLPEDIEHPAGRARAELVRATMAEEGVQVPQNQWNQLLVPDPRGRPDCAELGTFHADPASWQPLHVAQLPQLRERRLDYLREHAAPGTLVVLDQFFQPPGSGPTHGQMVAATARGEGFQGPLLELDATYSLQSETAARLEQVEVAQRKFDQATSPQEIRDSLRDLSVLKRGYALERSAESLEQLREAGLRDSAINLSLGHNAADEVRRLLQRTLEGSEQSGKVLVQLIRGFCDSPESLMDPRPEVAASERARLVGNLSKWLQGTTADPRWLASKQRYDRAVEDLEGLHNSVVVAAGNEGDATGFLQAWCGVQAPELPKGFQNNDLSNSLVTVVGASEDGRRAEYTSRDDEIDCFAAGHSLLGEEKGTSFAAPRVALRMAREHGRNPAQSSEMVEARFSGEVCC